LNCVVDFNYLILTSSFAASLTLLWLMTFVSCHRHGRGDTGRPKEKLTIVEPLNQGPYTVEIGGDIRIKCVATGFLPDVIVMVCRCTCI
jgi:hypothetical protein